MRQLTELTNEFKQSFVFRTEANQNFNFYLEFIPSQQSWYYNLSYGNLTLNGQRLATSPNILRQFRNLLPFGIACITDDASEPFLIDDFITERVKVYLLTPSDVLLAEDIIAGR